MAEILRQIRRGLVRVWRDEQGAEGLEKLLIIALLVLPLLAVLIFFGKEIRDWLSVRWEQVKDDSESIDRNFP